MIDTTPAKLELGADVCLEEFQDGLVQGLGTVQKPPDPQAQNAVAIDFFERPAQTSAQAAAAFRIWLDLSHRATWSWVIDRLDGAASSIKPLQEPGVQIQIQTTTTGCLTHD